MAIVTRYEAIAIAPKTIAKMILYSFMAVLIKCKYCCYRFFFR